MSKYVREVDSIQQLRNTPTSDAAAAHARTPTRQSGVFVPMDGDPFGRGDDGAVALQSANGEWWVRAETDLKSSVKATWWGAGPSASASTNRQAIQDAIDHVKSDTDGGVVVLPRGNFEIDGEVLLKVGVSLVGQGPEATQITLQDGADSNGIRVEGDTWKTPVGQSVRHLSLFGNASNQSGANDGLYFEESIMHTYVENVLVENFTRDGFHYKASHRNEVVASYSYNNGRDGFRLSPGPNVSDNHVEMLRNYAVGNDGAGLHLDSTVDANIMGVSLSGNGVNLKGSGVNNSTQITSVVCFKADNEEILLDDCNRIKGANITVIGDNSTSIPSVVLGGNGGGPIEKCQFNNLTIRGGGLDAINLYGRDNQLSDVFIDDTERHGINFEDGAIRGRNIITGLRVEMGDGANDGYAVKHNGGDTGSTLGCIFNQVIATNTGGGSYLNFMDKAGGRAKFSNGNVAGEIADTSAGGTAQSSTWQENI